MRKRKIYWLCQIFGWSSYGVLQIFIYVVSPFLTDGPPVTVTMIIGEILQVTFYLLSTHFLRYILIKNGWLDLGLIKLLPRILIMILVLGTLNYMYLLSYSLSVGELTRRDLLPLTMTVNIVGSMVIYFLWSIFYFAFHYFEQYNRSLKIEAAVNEMELNNLRAQLNPHFIFNALNSIRALVDENPIKSKNAITQLSNILRNSLIVDRKRLIPLKEELETVKDYLELESVRYEERLKVVFNIQEGSNDFLVPPLMIQTLIENGIKHGISKVKSSGIISFSSMRDSRGLTIQIRNTGQLMNGKKLENQGFGIKNTKKRLELLYGDKASFKIINENAKTVLTEIKIPVD